MLAGKPLTLYMDVCKGCGLVGWLVGMGKQSSRYLSYSNNFGIFLIEKKIKKQLCRKKVGDFGAV